ncbi:MAG: hypothetical protein J07HX5_00763, partial [halophilic archaeon J07HX5]
MHTAKYLIHAEIRTSGVVERSDVVGAVFGQTEGLLGETLDLRSLQDASKVGRIDVDIDATDGQSYGSITIATALDKAETAVLAAALETIDRVGPSRSEVTVVEIEDARAAERRAVVGRATELLNEVEEASLTDDQIVAEVRERARVADVSEYEGLPAGPRVADSDAVVVVEGRADVRRLLTAGIKNAVAVEGTDVPEAVATLTTDRTVTTFLDGDRGGDLILRELTQIGEIDHVAFAPDGESVEDLDRDAILSALRRKLPYAQVSADDSARAVFGADGEMSGGANSKTQASPEAEAESTTNRPAGSTAEAVEEPAVAPEVATAGASGSAAATTEARPPATLQEHVAAVIGDETGTVRLLDESFAKLGEADAAAAFDAVADAETVPATVVVDGAA